MKYARFVSASFPRACSAVVFYLALLNVRVTVGNELYGRLEGATLVIFAFQSRFTEDG